eukprot:scaffold1187_cov374-Prasinococcus_capsulatus_cf.AAC.2
MCLPQTLPDPHGAQAGAQRDEWPVKLRSLSDAKHPESRGAAPRDVVAEACLLTDWARCRARPRLIDAGDRSRRGLCRPIIPAGRARHPSSGRRQPGVPTHPSSSSAPLSLAARTSAFDVRSRGAAWARILAT